MPRLSDQGIQSTENQRCIPGRYCSDQLTTRSQLVHEEGKNRVFSQLRCFVRGICNDGVETGMLLCQIATHALRPKTLSGEGDERCQQLQAGGGPVCQVSTVWMIWATVINIMATGSMDTSLSRLRAHQ